VRIQKSLILDFNEKSVRESAEQDWRIDFERESHPEKEGSSDSEVSEVNSDDEVQEAAE
jgi:hypothetical protein